MFEIAVIVAVCGEDQYGVFVPALAIDFQGA
jgi:hypothetical protein